MSTIRQADCEQLLALTAGLYSVEDAAQWRRHFLDSLRPLISHEFGGCHFLCPIRREIRPCYAPERPGPKGAASLPAGHRDFWRLASQHPLHEKRFNGPA